MDILEWLGSFLRKPREDAPDDYGEQLPILTGFRFRPFKHLDAEGFELVTDHD
jgi:hypothetical protein